MQAEVCVKEGRLLGLEEENCFVFKGVPFARAGRFMPPEPLAPREGVFLADRFGSIAPQAPHRSVGLYGKEFYSDLSSIPPMSEDCLFLNIWSPKEGSGHPVALWIHGGGFCGGFSSETEFDGEAFARRGVVLVTLSYRLGLLGFLTHPDMEKVNLGLRDQLAALDWVRENILAFGGDPDSITLFGQSAGAMSAELLASSPYTVGKIRRVIVQSDLGYFAEHMLRGVPRSRRVLDRLSRRYWKKQGLSLDSLRALPPEELTALNEAYSEYMKAHAHAGFVLGPCADGDVIPCSLQRAVRRGRMPDIDYLFGCCLDDREICASGFDPEKHRLLKGVKRFCVLMNGKFLRKGRAYAYLFARRMPGSAHGAFHSAELWYVFGTLGRCWRPLEAHDYELSEKICDSWCRFIKEGDPGVSPCTAKSPVLLKFE